MSNKALSRTISIAPMMAYTDRHYRYLMRQITRHTLFYTEMVTAPALIYGNCQRLLAFSSVEHPLALQVGGSDLNQLVQCARIASEFNFDEINLNVGCPSTRVQSGSFGACLFKQPQLVADAVASMSAAAAIPVTVKTRIGVDEHDSYQHLYQFVDTVSQAGCQVFILHARKAWLKGLSPRQNREIPPLNYARVYQLKRDFPKLTIIMNGGIKTSEQIQQHLNYVDGVMVGREAYSNPYLFANVDQQFYDDPSQMVTRQHLIRQYTGYMVEQLAMGVPLRRLIKPLIGVFQGQPGAKRWRRHLTEQVGQGDIEVVSQALALTQ